MTAEKAAAPKTPCMGPQSFQNVPVAAPALSWPCMGFRLLPQTPLGRMTITYTYIRPIHPGNELQARSYIYTARCPWISVVCTFPFHSFSQDLVPLQYANHAGCLH